MSSWTPPANTFPTPPFNWNQTPRNGQVAMSSIQPTNFNSSFNAMNGSTGTSNPNGFSTVIRDSGNTMIDNRQEPVNLWPLVWSSVISAVVPSLLQLVGSLFNRPRQQQQPAMMFAQMPAGALPQAGAMRPQMITASSGGGPSRFGQRQAMPMMFAPMQTEQQPFDRGEYLRTLRELRKENAELQAQLKQQAVAEEEISTLFEEEIGTLFENAFADMRSEWQPPADRSDRASRHISGHATDDSLNNDSVSLSALNLTRPRSMRDFSLNANRFGVQQINNLIGPDDEVIPLEKDTTHNIISLQETELNGETLPSLYITAGIGDDKAYRTSYFKVDENYLTLSAGQMPKLWDAAAEDGKGAWVPFEADKTYTTANGATYVYSLAKDGITETSGALQIEAPNYEVTVRNASVNHALSLSGRLLADNPVAAGLVAETAEAGRQTVDDIDLTRYQVDAARGASLWSQRPSALARPEEGDEDNNTEESVHWANGAATAEEEQEELWATVNIATSEADRPTMSMAEASQPA